VAAFATAIILPVATLVETLEFEGAERVRSRYQGLALLVDLHNEGLLVGHVAEVESPRKLGEAFVMRSDGRTIDRMSLAFSLTPRAEEG